MIRSAPASAPAGQNGEVALHRKCLKRMAGWTGLEPAASGVTGRRYNQLNYRSSGIFILSWLSRFVIRDVSKSSVFNSS